MHWKQNFFLIITICLILVSSIYAKEEDCENKFTKDCPPTATPIWPDQFEQTFEETLKYPVLGSHSTNGKFFYDWTNKRYRVDRENGHYDRYCGSVYPFSNTECSHIVVDGDRYLWYPEKDYCCYCCSAQHGCGLLKPDWLSGAKFEDYVTEDGDDQTVFEKWNKPGLQDNFYFARAKDRVMRKIDQVPNDIQTFNLDSFSLGIKDQSVFTLPKECSKEKTCPFYSVCTAVRKLS
jgi:hypothetical protein